MRNPLLQNGFVLLLILALAASGAAAADNNGTLTALTDFEAVLERSLDVSDSIHRSTLQQLQAQASLDELEAALRPQFNFSGEHNRQSAGMNPLNQLLPGEDEPTWDVQASLTIAQQLGPNTQLQGGLEQAQWGLDASRVQHTQAVVDAMLEVQESYHNVLQAYQGKELAALALDNARAKLEDVRSQRDKGSATELDVLQKQNEVFQAETNWEAAQSGLQLAGTRLLQLLDLYPEDKEHLTRWAQQRLEEVDEAVHAWQPPLEDAWEYALDHRLELQLLDVQVQQAQIQYNTARSERDWTVSASGTYIHDDWALIGSVDSERLFTGTLAHTWEKDSDGMLSGSPMPAQDNNGRSELPEEWREEIERLLDERFGFGEPDDDANLWQIGLSVNYRFGDGGASRAEERRLEAAVEEAASERESMIDMLYLDVYAAHEDLSQSYRLWQLSLAHRREAEETFARLESSVHRGLLSQRDLEEAKLLIAQTNQEVTSHALKHQRNQAALAASIGLDDAAMFDGLAHGRWQTFD